MREELLPLSCYFLFFFFILVGGIQVNKELKHQQGKETCPTSHSLIVILTLDCLMAKPVLSPERKKDTAIIKLDLVYERKVEFSHILHSASRLLLSFSLSPPPTPVPMRVCFFASLP